MTGRAPMIAGGVAMALATGLAALLFPPLREAMGIARTDTSEFAEARGHFAAVMRQHAGKAATTSLTRLGLRARRGAPEWGGAIFAEAEGDCQGRGAYLLRESETLPLAITAPHRDADRHTGTLAAALFREGRAAAAAWNSAPRNQSDACPAAIDLAREERHLFTAFALAFADTNPSGLVLQLHGFDGERRSSEAARTAAAIVSSGTHEPGTRLLDIADCLSVTLDPDPVLVYPGETGELGALTNAQGQLLREAGFAGFVHLEMSAALRAQLVEDEGFRARFLSCLEEAAA